MWTPCETWFSVYMNGASDCSANWAWPSGSRTLAGLPTALAHGAPVTEPLRLALTGVLLSLVLVLPRVTPRWLSRPASGWQGVALVLALVVAQVLVFAPMATAALAGLALPASAFGTYLSWAQLPSAVTMLTLALTGVTLANWRDPAGSDTPALARPRQPLAAWPDRAFRSRFAGAARN